MRLRNQADKLLSSQVFRYNQIFLFGLAFLGTLLLAIYPVPAAICWVFRFNYCPVTWPVTVFAPLLPRTPDLVTDTLVAIALLILFYFAASFLARHRFRLRYVVVVGIALVIGSNLIQGFSQGLSDPVSGSTNQYFHDAISISDASDFLKEFNERQPDLLIHTRTHPPGPVLTIYGLFKLLQRPSLVAIAIALVSVSLSLFFVNRLLRTELGSPTADFATFLFVLIPAIQVYYLASIDALIASLLLGALYFFLLPQRALSLAGTVAFLAAASFVTFGFLFILPVLAGFELVRDRRLTKIVLILLTLSVLYLVLYIAMDFNYLRSFLTASALENPGGFRLIAAPVSYVFTRLEGMFLISAFFGPFLIFLWVRGIVPRQISCQRFSLRGVPAAVTALSPLYLLSILGVLSLLAMFATGAFATGETGRAASFIYPYLMFPVAIYLNRFQLRFRDHMQLSGLVFGQAVAMQLFGTYLW